MQSCSPVEASHWMTTPPPKNVLLMLADDLRPQLGCYNISVCGRKMQTPHIDALAAP